MSWPTEKKIIVQKFVRVKKRNKLVMYKHSCVWDNENKNNHLSNAACVCVSIYLHQLTMINDNNGNDCEWKKKWSKFF